MKRPLRTKSGKRPTKVRKPPIKAMVLVGISVGCFMGCLRAPLPWRKTAPLKRPIGRSVNGALCHSDGLLFHCKYTEICSCNFSSVPDNPALHLQFFTRSSRETWRGAKGIPAKWIRTDLLNVKRKGEFRVFSGCSQETFSGCFQGIVPYPLCKYPFRTLPRQAIATRDRNITQLIRTRFRPGNFG